MSTISTALGDAAHPLCVEFRGRLITISPLTGAIKSAFERYLEDAERTRLLTNAKAAREAGLIGPAEVSEMLRQFSLDCAKGRYAFGGQQMAGLMGSPLDGSGLSPAMMRLVGLLCGLTDEELFDVLLSDRSVELMSKIQQATAEWIPSKWMVEQAAADPKASAA